MFFFFNISLPFPFQNKENWKCLLASTNVSALCLDFDEVSAILQALHIRALLSRSSGEMKFDSSSRMLKPVYFAFVKTRVFFWQTTSTFAKTNEQNNRYDSFETRHFDEGKPRGEPPYTSLVQRSRMLMQKRPLLWISSLNARKTQVPFYEWISWAQGIYRIPTTLSRGLCSVTKNGFVFP